jgi:uncharacterized membrane protein
MKAELARRLENLLVLIAALLLVGGLYAWTYRVACIFGAIGVLLVIVTLRLKSRAVKRQATRTNDAYAAIERIREEREKRMGRSRARGSSRLR